MKSWMFVAAMAVASLFASASAQACSCLPFDFVRSYRQSDHVFAGRVLSSQHRGGWIIYDVFLVEDVKSCLPERNVVQVGTPDNQAACGTNLLIGGTYIIFASDARVAGQTVMTTNYCNEPQRIIDLSPAERSFLRDRPVGCGTGCADGSVPFTCFQDPCITTPACGPQAQCEANFCSGCTAEFYNRFDEAACRPW